MLIDGTENEEAIIMVLLAAGADRGIATQKGVTPIELARRSGKGYRSIFGKLRDYVQYR